MKRRGVPGIVVKGRRAKVFLIVFLIFTAVSGAMLITYLQKTGILLDREPTRPQINCLYTEKTVEIDGAKDIAYGTISNRTFHYLGTVRYGSLLVDSETEWYRDDFNVTMGFVNDDLTGVFLYMKFILGDLNQSSKLSCYIVFDGGADGKWDPDVEGDGDRRIISMSGWPGVNKGETVLKTEVSDEYLRNDGLWKTDTGDGGTRDITAFVKLDNGYVSSGMKRFTIECAVPFANATKDVHDVSYDYLPDVLGMAIYFQWTTFFSNGSVRGAATYSMDGVMLRSSSDEGPANFAALRLNSATNNLEFYILLIWFIGSVVSSLYLSIIVIRNYLKNKPL